MAHYWPEDSDSADESAEDTAATAAEGMRRRLQEGPALQFLYVRGEDIVDDAGAAAVVRELRRLPGLQSFGLVKSGIGAAGAAAVARELRNALNLQILFLDGNRNIGAAGMEAVARELRHAPSLQTLYLSCSDIGAAGAEALARELRHAPSLQSLYLGLNDIGGAGAGAVARELRHAPNLLSLDLSGNNIGAAGVETVARELRHAPSLELLRLRANHIGDAGAGAAVRELRHAPSLHTIDLDNNRIGAAGAEAVALALVEAPPPALRNVWGVNFAEFVRRQLHWPAPRTHTEASQAAVLDKLRMHMQMRRRAVALLICLRAHPARRAAGPAWDDIYRNQDVARNIAEFVSALFARRPCH
eukprot:CAMPEP_0118863624 /NCGR_PEP_ID=MMETSP1163-20130328/8424_1 /TAXON_ID=124430 /ORGANISM="Phaeomonas parva, Strain CCMP2877" /LENGTH=358 /DNA_ID=CAMNT_0006797647 /DNA_START=94 /DNA_END=1170 /DNA_ORIENTATION=-